MPTHFWPYKAAANQRLDPSLYSQPGRPVSFTIRCYRDSEIFRNPKFAGIVVECLLAQQSKSDCRLIAYCVMPTHVHAIAEPNSPNASTLALVDWFKGWCSRELGKAGGVGKVWQPRSHDHIIRDDEDLRAHAMYVVHNPVRAGLVESWENYEWSGLLLDR